MKNDDHKRVAIRAARAMAADADSKFESATADWKLRPCDRDFLHRITTHKHPSGLLLMSNTHVRLRATRLLIRNLLRYRVSLPLSTPFEYFFVTLCAESAVTTIETPTLDLRRLKKQVDYAFRSRGLNAVCVLDVDVLTRAVWGENDVRVLWHVHAIVWTFEEVLRPKSLETELSASPAFHNLLGPGATVRVRQPRSTYGLLGLAIYMMKQRAIAKNPVPSRERPGEYLLREDPRGLTRRMAVRLRELWSLITALDAVFSVGEGKHITRPWRQGMRRWERDKGKVSGSVHCLEDVLYFWRNVARHIEDYYSVRPRIKK